MPEAPCSERQQSSGLGSCKNFKSPKELTANQKEKKNIKYHRNVKPMIPLLAENWYAEWNYTCCINRGQNNSEYLVNQVEA